jgi:hypothetical protein
VEIVAKTAWGSRKTTITNKTGALPVCYIHHTAGYYPPKRDEEDDQMRTLQHIAIDVNGHQDIEYNWVIGPSGAIYEARGIGKLSAATNDQNQISRSICLMGNFQTKEPTELSIQAVVDLICHLIDMNNLTEARKLEIFGHRDNPLHPNATACPGNNVYKWLPHIRDKVIHYQKPEGAHMKDRLLRQKGFANILKVGGGENPIALSGELMQSVESEIPNIPKIYQDHTISFFAMCRTAGLNPTDPSQVVPYPNDPGRFE